jgi:hypothetical protein
MASNSNPTSEYNLAAKRKLTSEEVASLAEEHWPVLQRLSRRYLPDLDTSNGVPQRAEFLDFIRGKWLLDRSADRPSHDDVVSGVGFGFGLLLNAVLGMEWWLIQDTYGEAVSMVKSQDDAARKYEVVSVPPFNYVAKRRDAQNVEVFADGLREIEMIMNA